MSVKRGLLVAVAVFLFLGVLVFAGGRALDPISLVVFCVIPVVAGVVAGRRRSMSAARSVHQ